MLIFLVLRTEFCDSKFHIMALVYLVLTGLINLAGVFFNIRMLLNCFKNQVKFIFLQKCRPLIICQFVYETTFLATSSVEAWRELDVQTEESCCVLRVLSMSANIFLAFNLAALWISQADQPLMYKNRQLSPLLLMAVAQCFGCVNSALAWWGSSLNGQFSDSQLVIIFILNFVSVFLLYLLVARKNCTTKPEHINASATGATSLLWNGCKEHKETISFIAFLIMSFALVITLSDSLLTESERSKFFKVFNLFKLFQNFVVGIALPVYINYLVETSSKDTSEATEYGDGDENL